MKRTFPILASVLLLSVSTETHGHSSPTPAAVTVAPIKLYLKDPAARKALSVIVQAQATKALSEDPSDQAVRRSLLVADRAAALTLGQWDRVISLTSQIRQLEPKPAMQRIEGLVFEAFARASRGGHYSSRRFSAELSSSLRELDGSLTASSLRALRAQYFLMSRNSVIAELQGRIAAQLSARENKADVGLASNLLEQLILLDQVVPELGVIERALATRLSAADMQIEDLWSARQVVLGSTLPLSKVIVGIWDSGVDAILFPNRLWTNPRELLNGRDDDKNGFVDDLHGFAFDANRQPSTGLLGQRPGGNEEGFDRLARYSKGWSDLDTGEVTEDAVFARSIANSLTATERAAFNLDLDRFSFFTHGTGIASIAAAGNPAAELMVGRLDYRIGQVPPPIDEAEATLRVAYADKAIEYFKANGARVVNMSFRLTLPNVEASLAAVESDPERRRNRAEKIYNMLHEGFERAVRSAPEILFVAGAGNSNENNDLVRSFPAGIEAENLMVVGAVDARLLPADISSFGKSVDVYALGVSVPQKLVGGRTIRFTGTSSATPQVANLAAKLLALCPKLSVAQLRGIILGTATKEGPQRLRIIHPRAAVAQISNRPAASCMSVSTKATCRH